MNLLARKSAVLTVALLLVSAALSGCGSAAHPNELDLRIQSMSSGPDSLSYTIQASGAAVDGSSRTYAFDCVRRSDGTSTVRLSQDGKTVATATRTKDQQVELSAASGLHASSSTGTIDITESQRAYLSAAQWALLDTDAFSRYPMDPVAASDLKAWRDGLDLVDAVEPAPSQAAAGGTLRTQVRKHCYPIYIDPRTGQIAWMCIYY